ncbi:MAG TPA: hypothetical protein VJ810_40340 [Blastocatellia bacterium]|nr:hypothetical protein [Blastocatellia bacterium]
MNYERFKKVMVWLALMCVFAIPLAPTFTSPAYAQGYYRRYDRWERRHDRDQWRRRRIYRNPWARGRNWDRYPNQYRRGYYDRYGRFNRSGYNRDRFYPRRRY